MDLISSFAPTNPMTIDFFSCEIGVGPGKTTNSRADHEWERPWKIAKQNRCVYKASEEFFPGNSKNPNASNGPDKFGIATYQFHFIIRSKWANNSWCCINLWKNGS